MHKHFGQTGAWHTGTDGEICQPNVSCTPSLGREERRVASRAGRKTKQTRHGSLESQIIPVQQTKSNKTSQLAGGGWLLRAQELQNQPGELIWCSPSLNPTSQISWHHHGEAALVSVRGHTHTELPAGSRRGC